MYSIIFTARWIDGGYSGVRRKLLLLLLVPRARPKRDDSPEAESSKSVCFDPLLASALWSWGAKVRVLSSRSFIGLLLLKSVRRLIIGPHYITRTGWQLPFSCFARGSAALIRIPGRLHLLSPGQIIIELSIWNRQCDVFMVERYLICSKVTEPQSQTIIRINRRSIWSPKRLYQTVNMWRSGMAILRTWHLISCITSSVSSSSQSSWRKLRRHIDTVDSFPREFRSSPITARMSPFERNM